MSQKNDFGAVLTGLRQSAFPVEGNRHLVPGEAEHLRQALGCVSVVLNNEHPATDCGAP